MEDTDSAKLETYESEYGKLTPAYRRKLIEILERDTVDRRNSGLTVLALKAFPSSPKQKFIQSLRLATQDAGISPSVMKEARKLINQWDLQRGYDDIDWKDKLAEIVPELATALQAAYDSDPNDGER